MHQGRRYRSPVGAVWLATGGDLQTEIGGQERQNGKYHLVQGRRVQRYERYGAVVGGREIEGEKVN